MKKISLCEVFDKQEMGLKFDFLNVVFGCKLLHFMNEIKKVNLSALLEALSEMRLVVLVMLYFSVGDG